MNFEIHFTGHQNIRSLHQKTIEITKESQLTPSGDCIVGVNATHGCASIPETIKKKLRDPNTVIKFTLKIGTSNFSFKGYGHQDLILSHPEDIVIRKSNFICPRTLAINADASSDSIPRSIIKNLQEPNSKGIFKISIE